MDPDIVRQLIRHRLLEKRLPQNRLAHVWEMPGNEHPCNGCGLPLSRGQTIVWGIAARDLMTIELHADCFEIWESERLQRRPLHGTSKTPQM